MVSPSCQQHHSEQQSESSFVLHPWEATAIVFKLFILSQDCVVIYNVNIGNSINTKRTNVYGNNDLTARKKNTERWRILEYMKILLLYIATTLKKWMSAERELEYVNVFLFCVIRVSPVCPWKRGGGSSGSCDFIQRLLAVTNCPYDILTLLNIMCGGTAS